MTAQLLTFETTHEGQKVTVELFYDKHDMFTCTVIIGEPEKRYPSYKNSNNPNLGPALAAYKRQRSKYTTKRTQRTETISSLFDDALKSYKASI